ncbi:hypothetical protein KC573_01750 [candidate division WWE3 bacterium]|uniref:Uncharacterized protein n=1 Tax=candidate division WWE3 bacterium TaxID=2053526 RepID=A0A955RWX3_UNCKA|nr:hypothetical protein [candidate division WWE3 bacterium]
MGIFGLSFGRHEAMSFTRPKKVIEKSTEMTPVVGLSSEEGVNATIEKLSGITNSLLVPHAESLSFILGYVNNFPADKDKLWKRIQSLKGGLSRLEMATKNDDIFLTKPDEISYLKAVYRELIVYTTKQLSLIKEQGVTPVTTEEKDD